MLGVGQRKFAELVATATWLPPAVALGPRLRRWLRVELLEAISQMPRPGRQEEPAQLLRARIERMKSATAQG